LEPIDASPPSSYNAWRPLALIRGVCSKNDAFIEFRVGGEEVAQLRSGFAAQFTGTLGDMLRAFLILKGAERSHTPVN